MTATLDKFSLNFVQFSYHHIRTTTQLKILKIDKK